MASELNPAEQNNPKSGESRRSFLAKLGIGAAALALVAGPLSALRGNGSNSGASPGTRISLVRIPSSTPPLGRIPGASIAANPTPGLDSLQWPCLPAGHCCSQINPEDDSCPKRDSP